MRTPANSHVEPAYAPAIGPVLDSCPASVTHGDLPAAPAIASPDGVMPSPHQVTASHFEEVRLSRRSLVVGMAAGVMPAVVLPAAATGSDGEHLDARLIKLGAQYQHLCKLEAAADEAYERACERVQEVERPPVLRHRMEDHLLGLELPFDQANAPTGFSADAEANPFYTPDEMRRLRHAPPLEEPTARAEQRARIEEIERAWQAHLDACWAVDEIAGVNAADEAIKEIGRMKRILVKEIAAVPAKTLAGVRVRAAIVAHLVDDTGPDDCNDDLMMAAIVRDILAMPV